MFKEFKLKAKNVRSLSWCKDELVDWVSGGVRYSLNGKVIPRDVSYSYPFDSAIVSTSGMYAAIYSKNQTKGLLLKNGKILREINRSFYHAHAYDFPIAFAEISNGNEVLIHCPDEYCILEIEDLDSGEILTVNPERNPSDFFHSRLEVSPGGKWLLSAGWVWHPIDVVGLFNLSASIENSMKLDKPELGPPGLWEISSASFLDDDHVFVSSSDEFLGDEGDPVDDQPGRFHIALWSLESNKYLSSVSCGQAAGRLMPISKRFVVSFYEHPKLWDLESGRMIHEWVDLQSGTQTSSITYGSKMPPIAVDIKNHRFAIGLENEISVVVFD